MAKLEEEIKRATASGDRKVAGFKGATRSVEVVSLEVGDVLHVPENPDVFEQKIGKNTVQYIWVTTQEGNAKKLFPGTFTKSRQIYDEDGVKTGERVFTRGTAAEEFRKHMTIKESMASLYGKDIAVTNQEMIRTLNFDRTEVVDDSILTIDFVEK